MFLAKELWKKNYIQNGETNKKISDWYILALLLQKKQVPSSEQVPSIKICNFKWGENQKFLGM